jgi:hypothetical protein
MMFWVVLLTPPSVICRQVTLESPAVQSPVVPYHEIEKFFPNFPDIRDIRLRQASPHTASHLYTPSARYTPP